LLVLVAHDVVTPHVVVSHYESEELHSNL